MRLSSLYIDGFGHFHDWTPPGDFAENLTILTGPNEAGKTTLLSFVRRMLYGFPHGNTQVNHYHPRRGGSLGGRLMVRDEDGKEVVLERYGRATPVFHNPDGSAARGWSIESLIGPAKDAFYKNVCAISLDELQKLSTLNEEGIRDRLAAAGAGNLPIREVDDALKEQCDPIYTPRGKKKEVNKLIAAIRDKDEEIKDAKDLQAEYDGIHENLAELRSERLAEKEKLDEQRRNLNYQEALQKAWEPFNARKTALQELEEIPEIDEFPPDALEQLARLESPIEEYTRAIDSLDEKISKQGELISQFQPDKEILGHAETIRELDRGVVNYQSQDQARREITIKVQNLHKELSDILDNLGDDWDTARIQDFDTSIPAREEATQLRNRLNTCTSALESAKRVFESKKSDYSRDRLAYTTLHQRRNKIGEVPRPDDARSQRDQARELKGYIDAIHELTEKIESTRQAEAQKDEILNSLKREPPSVPVWPGVLVLLCAGVAILAGAITGTLLTSGILAVILVIAAAGIFLVRRHREEGTVDPDTVASYEEAATTLSGQREEYEDKLQQVTASAEKLANGLHLDKIPSKEGIQNIIDSLQDQLGTAEKAHELDQDIAEARTRCESAHTSCTEAEEQLQRVEGERDRAQTNWKRWCTDRNLPPSLDPENILNLFAAVERARTTLHSIEELKQEDERRKARMDEFDGKVKSVISDLGLSYSDTPDKKADDLMRQLTEATDADNQRRQAEQTFAGLEEERKETIALCQKARDSLDRFLQDRGAKDASDYRDLFSSSQKRVDLSEKITAAETTIRGISGADRYDEFISNLAEYDPLSADDAIERIHRAIEETSGRIEGIDNTIGGCEARKKEIEENHDLQRLLSERAALTGELEKASRRWAVLTAAQFLLSKAVETFEKERQPQILKEAQHFFNRFTDGKYTRVVMPLDGSDLYVEEATGRQKKTDELSRGTKEQLYLALRFGYIRDYANSAGPLPVIFDDILVNFDPDRRHNACEAIRDLSESCQVLYFTCHPELVNDLTNAVSDAVVIPIEGK